MSLCSSGYRVIHVIQDLQTGLLRRQKYILSQFKPFDIGGCTRKTQADAIRLYEDEGIIVASQTFDQIIHLKYFP